MESSNINDNRHNKINKNRQVKLKNLFDEQVVIEDSEEHDNSVYSLIYNKADYLLEKFKDNFNEINKKFNEINKKTNRYGRESKYQQEDLQVVNTISFEGRRGTGKTSAMMSYCSKLRKSKGYIVLDYIDASALEEGENVLEIVLANMYNVITEHITENPTRDDYESRNIIRKFEKIYSSIKFINERRDKTAGRVDLSPLSGLERLSNSQQLKREVYDLICKFERYITSDEAILIVPIDDVDLCFHSDQSSVYEVMETLHRYLMIPNVVIFLTYDYPEILSGCVKHFSQMFYGESFYSESFSNDKQYSHNKQHIRDVANRYLEKVLPTYARIHLPSQRKRDYMDQNNIQVLVEADDIEGYLKEFKEYLMTENSKNQKETNINSSIILNPKRFALLFKASNFGLFYDSQGQKRHYAEPSDFRDMVHIVTMCKELRDFYRADNEDSDEFVFKELLDDLYFRFARVELSPNEEEYDQFNEYLKVNIERRSRDILDDIWDGLKVKLGDDKYPKVCSKIEYNYKPEIEQRSYSYGELLYGLYRASSNKLLKKNLIWCILDSYTIMLTKLHRSIKRKERLFYKEKGNGNNGIYDELLSKDESYKTMKGIIGLSISSSWSNYFVPGITTSMYSGPERNTITLKTLKLGAIKIKNHNIDNDKFRPQWHLRLDDMGQEKAGDVLKTIEILCMFFTDVIRNDVNDDNIFFKIEYSEEGNDDVVKVDKKRDWIMEKEFTFIFDGCCFNILNFVVNMYFGEEYFYTLHKKLKKGLEKYLKEKNIQEDIDSWINKHSLYKKDDTYSSGGSYDYKSWKEKYDACAMPIYSFDMMYNILKRLYLDILETNPSIYDECVTLDKFIERLLDVYKEIEKALDKQDSYYYPESNKSNELQDKKSFKKAFKECPFIQYMNTLGLNGKNTNENQNTKKYLEKFFLQIAQYIS